MISFNHADALQKKLYALKSEDKRIGFVPTMGALHMGHLSLIKAASEECDIVVCSIFVNPTQFNNEADLEKYPRTLESDKELLQKVKCDILFTPSVNEIYPDGYTNTYELPQLGNITNCLEGKFRPGHFEGMMQVVSLLLDIVNPTHLYMGLKDYQQYAIVVLMVKAQKRDTIVRGMPTVREDSGLAMSSRNKRLNTEAKENAKVIYEALAKVQAQKELLSINELESLGKHIIESVNGMEVEYFNIVDASNLEPTSLNEKNNLIALTAVWYKNVRLIDNMIL